MFFKFHNFQNKLHKIEHMLSKGFFGCFSKNCLQSLLCFNIFSFKNVAEGEYVRRYTLSSKREYVTGMIKNIKSELELAMQETSWMDTETKSNAKIHLKIMTEEVGWTKLVYDVQAYEKSFGYHRVRLNMFASESN